MKNAALETAKEVIETLEGLIDGLQEKIDRARQENESLREELEEYREAERELMKEMQEEAVLMDSCECEESLAALGEKLRPYYRDLDLYDEKRITSEDGETLYHTMKYIFKQMKKAGIPLE